MSEADGLVGQVEKEAFLHQEATVEAENEVGDLTTAVDRNDTGPTPDTGPGLCIDALARLPSGTILDERTLAGMFGCHPVSIKRAVQRGELPAPVRMFGRPCWTAGRILEHVAARLLEAQKEVEREAQRLSRLSP